MSVNKLFVIGTGFMGSGIIENAAEKGIHVVGYDISEESLERSKANITKSLDKSVKKARISEHNKRDILSKITWTTNMADCRDADVIIEAATENQGLKIKIMKDIEQNANPEAIIASNTSSISITTLGSVFSDPSRFVGMHFFSPVPKMPLIEIIRGLKTGERAKQVAIELGNTLGKTCIQSRDEAGFLINRMLLPMLNEACWLVERSLGTIEEIDLGVKLGLNHPMGPFELLDMIGVDVELSVMQVLYSEIGDQKYRPAQILRRMVSAGYLGRKSGIGFYVYHEDGTKTPNYEMLK